MFGKKKPPAPHPLVTRQSQLRQEVYDAQSALQERVIDVLVKKWAVSVYPDGPDKNKAVSDLDKARYSLLCSIGAYDGMVSNANHWMSQYKPEDFPEPMYYGFNFKSSHWWIEYTIKEFYKIP